MTNGRSRFVSLTPGLCVSNGSLVGGLPSVSVVISTNRRGSLLPLTLASVAAVEGVDIEVLVFDDTPGQDLVVPDGVVPDVRVVRRGECVSRGLGFARSRLLSQVEGDVVVVMDDDFIVDGVVLRELAEVHRRVDGPVIASAPLYLVREDFARDVTPDVVFELVRCGQLERLASAYLLDSHYTVREYGKVLNSGGDWPQTLLAGHSSFASFRSDLPSLLGIDYLPIRRAEDSAFGDAALTRGAGFVWCQAGSSLHVGLTEMDRLRVSNEEFQQFESWRRSVSFGWLPTSGRPNVLPKRGLDRTWARPSVAICLFLEGIDRTSVAQILGDLSRWETRDWVVTVADEALLDGDSRSVLEQFRLDDSRYIDPEQFRELRWNATWQLFTKPVNVEDVYELMKPLAERPLHLLHASSGWADGRGYIVRSHLLARKRVRRQQDGLFVNEAAGLAAWQGVEDLIPISADLKRLQSEDEVTFHLVASPEVMLISEDTVVSLIDLSDSVSQFTSGSSRTARVTVLASPDELDKALRTHRDDIVTLMRHGVLIDQGAYWSPTHGHSDSNETGIKHRDYLDWRIHQKRQFLKLAHRPEVDEVSFGIVITTKRPQMWADMVANLARQTHKPTGVLIVCHGWTPSNTQLQAVHNLHIPHTTISILDSFQTHSAVVGWAVGAFDHGEWLVKMDDDDLYGAQFLQELATHITLNPTIQFFGMYAEFIEIIHPHTRSLAQRRIGWQAESGRYQGGCPAGGTLCFASEHIRAITPYFDLSLVDDQMLGEALNKLGVPVQAIDGLNYVYRRRESIAHSHAWNPDLTSIQRSWIDRGYGRYLGYLFNE